MPRRALLLDLGNRRLKSAWSAGGALEEVRSHPLPGSEEGWRELARRLGGRHDGPGAAAETWISSSNPAALPRLLELLAGGRSLVAGRDFEAMPAASRGTGADRLLGAYAAWRRAGRAVLVASFGTAWTLDAADRGGLFQGGAIGPGLGVLERALAQACPHLAGPRPGAVPAIPGDTGGAVACGTREALAAAVLGLARRFELALGEPAARFVTGGDGELLRPLLGAEWTPAAHLVLEGLAWRAAAS